MRKKPHGAAAPLIAVDRNGERPLPVRSTTRSTLILDLVQPGQQIRHELPDGDSISRITVLSGAYSQLLAEVH